MHLFLNSILDSHWSIWLIIPVQHSPDYYSFAVCFQIRRCDLTDMFFHKIVVIVLNSLHFHIDFRISSRVSAKKKGWGVNFLRSWQGLYWIVDQFGKYLNYMKYFNPWTWDVFPFILELFNFFQQYFLSPVCKLYNHVDKFILMHFILFNVTTGAICSFPYCSFLICETTIDFHILILHHATLLNSIINIRSSGIFLFFYVAVFSLGFSMCKIKSFANR